MLTVSVRSIIKVRLLSRIRRLRCLQCLKFAISAACILIAAGVLVHLAELRYDILETEKLAVNKTLITFRLSNQWGMGNEMFALASTYGTMRSSGDRMLCVDRNTFILKVFRLENLPRCSAHVLVRFLDAEERREFAYAVYDPTLRSLPAGRHAVVGRFLQSWRYFDGREYEIRKLLTFDEDLLGRARQVLTCSVESLAVCRGCSRAIIKIGIHVRRGNMVSDPVLREKGYKVPDEGYFDRAIGFYKERFPNERMIFVVCSDSLDWCKEALRNRNDVAFVETGRAELDMAVLSLCNHSIITVGSFGWWAAWLANGTTLYYKDWPRKDSLLAFTTVHADYFPPTWIGL